MKRVCNVCKEEKELNIENFFFDKRRLHQGIGSAFRKECRKCKNKKHQISYRDNHTKNITDKYIIKTIRRFNKNLSFEDIKNNKELIELYRLNIQLKREIRNDRTT